ncbi:ROK family protein [Niallia circulans]|uniref:ROK family protein n=1 Tax=Niallia circulans TaxID=1397 RepID=A0A553SU48_NIACI|nr:ROK family protein [Niallia circulans]TRZ40501.1 ROK family protein [Niallia circulans]
MYLVLDIGGTFVKFALMDASGKITHRGKTPASRENRAEFEDVIFSIIDKYDSTHVKGIAISCPGTIDVESGMIYHGGSFPFLHKVNLKQRIEEKYQKEVSIENDGKCAALAELWLGNLKNVKDAVVLVLGSGVGGGIIMNGKIHRGFHQSSGEVSYVMDNIEIQTRVGQFFGFACSAVEMIRRIAELKKLTDKTDGESVFKYIVNKDEEAMVIFDEFCIHLATQILNLQYILDPETFAIGGGISAQPVLLERIHWALAEVTKANPMHVANPKVVACKFQNDANLYGALYHFFISKEKQIVG